MDREEIRDMDGSKLVELFEKLLRNGAGRDYYVYVWTRDELVQRIARTGPIGASEVCPTCGEVLVEGVGHDHRDVDAHDRESRGSTE